MTDLVKKIVKKMKVNAVISHSDPRFAIAQDLFTKAGYPGNIAELEEISCGRGFDFLHNGFVQTFCDVPDLGKARVVIYYPNQELQPHQHDLDEDFVITYGIVQCSIFDQATKKAETTELRKGQNLKVPKETVHCVKAGPHGLVFHETVGSDAFGKRSTVFRPEFGLVPPALTKQNVVVTGGNRGIGLGFVKKLLELNARVIATCRDPNKAIELQQLKEKYPPGSLQVVPLDLTDPTSISNFVQVLDARAVDRVDLLINNAGRSSPNHPVDPIITAAPKVMMEVYHTNVVGTVSVTQALLPLMRKSQRRVAMWISSQLASIESCFGIQGRYGGVARCSRAAGNMAMRCFGGELKDENFIFVAMSPGHVAAGLGALGNRKAPVTLEDGVNGMLNVIQNVTNNDNGKFLQYDGAELPW